MQPGKKRIVVIGGGASGTLLTYHLLRSQRSGVQVTIVESASQLGFGLAYSTRDPGHLLNVRNANMSALPDDPSHFRRWLARDRGLPQEEIEPEGFASRQSYGRYIASLIDDVRARHTGEGNFEVKRGVCIGLWESPEGVRVRLADGRNIAADIAVIATGHDPDRTPNLTDPWRNDDSTDTDRVAPILILGSGLTMVDYVWTLLARGHTGSIHVLSRRGLLPSVHRPVVARQYRASDIPARETLSRLLHWVRKETGDDWRSVIDGLRPHTQAIWQTLPASERARFLRHARPWWDVHRHRMAPDVAKIIHAATASGQLRLHAGKVSTIAQDDEGYSVKFRRRGLTGVEQLHAARVVDCTGLPTDPTKSRNPLTKHLLATELARLDPVGLGLEFTKDCALVRADGAPSSRVFGVGPVTRPQFWEIIAIPDIRNQCAGLAERLSADTGESSRRTAA
ncbi:MAG: FAD/NAD(P)-binding protein [Rhizobiales bacterium]|nr:FAD/NAD(P)-binding protein [Hyphomicrobiales bacterium]